MMILRVVVLLWLAVLSSARQSGGIPSCAQPCIMSALNALGETQQTFRDMCNDKKLQTRIMNCAMESCTLEEIGGFKNMGNDDLCAMPLHNNQASYRAIVSVFAAVSTVSVLVRIAWKLKAKIPWGADDTWIVVTFFVQTPFTVLILWAIQHGLGKPAILFTEDQILGFYQEMFVFQLLYVVCIATTKTSILFFYLRIFPDAKFRIVVWITIAFNGISMVVLVTLNLSLGRIAAYLLDPKKHGGIQIDQYMTSNQIVLTQCSVNVVLDVWMLILPMTQLYNIGLKLDKRITVMAMFGLGGFVTAASVVRMIFQIQFIADPSRVDSGQLAVVIWACIETYVGSVVACLPSIRQFLARTLSNMMSTTGSSGSKPILIDRSLARISDEEEMPTLSDVGGLTSVSITSGTDTKNGTDVEMDVVQIVEK